MKKNYTIEKHRQFLRLTIKVNKPMAEKVHNLVLLFALILLTIFFILIAELSIEVSIFQSLFMMFWIGSYGYKRFVTYIWDTKGKEFFEIDRKEQKIIFYRKGIRTFDWTECSFSQLDSFSFIRNREPIQLNGLEERNATLCLSYEKKAIRFGSTLDPQAALTISKEINNFIK